MRMNAFGNCKTNQYLIMDKWNAHHEFSTGCASACKGVPVRAWVCQCVYGCTSVCMGVPVHARVCQCMQECANACM